MTFAEISNGKPRKLASEFPRVARSITKGELIAVTETAGHDCESQLGQVFCSPI